MRRKDREITDTKQIEEIVKACDVCRLAFADEKAPYIVPMNFGYTCNNQEWTLFFHCAGTGKKLDLMKNNPYVAFEMDCNHELLQGQRWACQCGMAYASVMGLGTAQLILEPQKKREALGYLMAHYTTNLLPFEEDVLCATTVFKVKVESITAKSRKL
ncbi:MAG: pyridoxamine 5'-phosphate oxidase family protein [Oscillospiraceae bacterium]|nr:pyridoxamine 5'-phosphate oxidase family protein [Oscillospiraceae bacterium]